MAANKEMEVKPPLVEIKKEHTNIVSKTVRDTSLLIKTENTDADLATEKDLSDLVIKTEPTDKPDNNQQYPDYIPEIENVTIKIEPTFYESEGEPYDDVKEEFKVQFNTSTPVKPTRKYKKRFQSDSDEDYVPKKKKKKIKDQIKKTYTTKAKRLENLYSEDVTKFIEVVTISEADRLAEFRETWQSRQHMRYACQYCAIGFVLEDAYLMHMKSHSPELGDHECDICHCRSRTADILYRHRLRHHRRYRCTRCDKLHKDKETAASHVMSHHTRLAFTCTQCGRGFKRPAYLKKHVAQQHDKSERHECPEPECPRVFHDKSALRSHHRLHNDESRQPVLQEVICDVCSRKFRSKQHLRRHIDVHGAARREPCRRCGAAFTTRRGLKLHIKNQHRERVSTGPAACPHCERTCTTPALLRLHVRRMHSDRTKKYQCDHCKRFYFSKGELRSHIQWSHQRSQARAHPCHCGQVFRTNTRLRNHINLHHLKIEPERKYVCYCGKGFASKPVLSRHMKSHENLTYPCPECGLRFKSEPYVKVHHQLKHLNMTRAQIKAQKKPREIHFLEGNKIKTVVLSGNKKERKKKIMAVEAEVKSERVPQLIEQEKISVPLFDFVDLKREID